MTVAAESCQAIIEHHSKSFALASKLLPARCRAPAIVLYAWCRRCDDAVDACPVTEQAAALAQLHRELDTIYSGKTTGDEVLDAFAEVVRRFQIPELYPRELLRGMAMDVEGRSYGTEGDLLDYCYCVAGVVGLMMCHVLGVSSDDALPHAAHLGLAMQLTNICRDVKEDWDRGRIYIPQEMLGDSGHELLASGDDSTDVIRSAVRSLLLLADRYYRSGDAGLRYLSPRCALSIRTARMVYSGIGRAIEVADFDVMGGRTFLSKGKKIRLAAWSAARGIPDLARIAPPSQWRAPQALLEARDVIRLG